MDWTVSLKDLTMRLGYNLILNTAESELWLGPKDKTTNQCDFIRVDMTSGSVVYSADYQNIGDVYSIN